MSKDKVFLNTIYIFMYNFKYLWSIMTLLSTRTSKTLLRATEKDIIL